MKRKLIILTAVLALCLLILPACNAQEAGSLKSITKPYIAQYECTEAKLGEQDILEKYDYIKIILVDKNEMNVVYKPKDGEKRIVKNEYMFDTKTKELSAEIGIFGYSFKQSVTVQNGQFTINKTIGNEQLVMKFKAQ